ncbi:hypothetical protein FOZ63_017533 [Perkinsus olseni]|uniref:Small nuclear ribonucleoprotein G n=2 Tax=Perkinsus olseni TaxID=32597 RepID=A0A7J6PBK5_PEROL|nr:hypothetical protein FOZ60_010677 [Perkinsus olseni]KAF4725919.1 hypothetical protein FOZ63_017533 [Perkinsus olseni]
MLESAISRYSSNMSSSHASIPKAGAGADLRRFMEKRIDVKLNADRHVVGVVRGYDQFMNLVLDNAVELVSRTEKREIGMVVIRGNSIMMWECLDRVKNC